MTVRTILEEKGRDVVVIGPTAKLDEAARLLADRHIGALVVLGADERLVGILSERDIVRALAARGAAVLGEPLAQVMTRDVVTCRQADTISNLMEGMTARKFRHMPVVENDRIVGIVSIGDVVKWRLQEMERESSAMQDYIRTA